MKELVSCVSQLIPPLSVWQSGQLSVVLPFLSAALSRGTIVLPEQTDENNTVDSLLSMVPYLTDCAVSSDFDARARSAAAACLYHVITKFQRPGVNDCLSREALRDNVMPTIVSAVESLKGTSDSLVEKATVDLCESLDVAALLVRKALHCSDEPESRISCLTILLSRDS